MRKESGEIIRFGVSEDFAGRHLPGVLAAFSRANPMVRLDVRADLSVRLRTDYEQGDLDIALFKVDEPVSGAFGSWREHLMWSASAHYPLPDLEPVPLALFPQGLPVPPSGGGTSGPCMGRGRGGWPMSAPVWPGCRRRGGRRHWLWRSLGKARVPS